MDRNSKIVRIIKIAVALIIAVVYVIKAFPMIKTLKMKNNLGTMGNTLMNLFQFLIVLTFILLLLWMLYQAILLVLAVLDKEDSALGMTLTQIGELGVSCFKELISIVGGIIFGGMGIVAMTVSEEQTNDLLTARIVGAMFVAGGVFLCIVSIRKMIPEIKDCIAVIEKQRGMKK